MKICYVANSRFPSERAHMTQIVQMCNAFAREGSEVVLLVTDRKTDITESPEAFFGVPCNFTITRIPVPDVAGAAPKIPVLLRPYLFFIQRLAFVYGSIRHIKRQDYTHVYGRDEWILWLLSFFIRIPIIWESHEARYSFAGRKLLSSKKMSPLIVISEGIRDFYVARGVSGTRILVAHDAVDARFFETHITTQDARAVLGITTLKPVVIYIGGLEGWKGAEILCKASESEHIFETYIIGGKAPEIEAMRVRYPQVHFLGSRPYRELPNLQQAADVLVIPNTGTTSVSREYTSPLKLFAYMTARKTIVASRIPSITNVLSEDEAFFFEPDDSADLANVIKQVVHSQNEARVRAERAYRKSLRYTWTRRVQTILEFLEYVPKPPSTASWPRR